MGMIPVLAVVRMVHLLDIFQPVMDTDITALVSGPLMHLLSKEISVIVNEIHIT